MVQPDKGPERKSPNQRETPIALLDGAAGGDLHTVGDGASALRFNFGPGYRVCSAQKSDSLMLLLYRWPSLTIRRCGRP